MKTHLGEGDPVPDDLTPYWGETASDYGELIRALPQHRCVRWLMEHIIHEGYSKKLFPGTSMYQLLISTPEGGKVDYGRTLRIGYDELKQVVVFSLKMKKIIAWEITCQPSEVIDGHAQSDRGGSSQF